MANRLVVFGSGGHAKVVVEAALAAAPGREIVLLDDDDRRTGARIFGMAVAGGRSELTSLRGAPVVPAMGSNETRAKLLNWLQEQGHALETVIHPSAIVADSVRIEPGSFVSAGAIIIAEACIGAGTIINTGASVDHDCVIGRAAHVAPGAHLCGNVRIGDRTLVGVGASIRPSISLCADVVLGAGSVVVRDITVPGTFAGNPARPLR
jgi:sugar O-acyltransferase (sialic acid O-acetyltransferase NeuD family)